MKIGDLSLQKLAEIGQQSTLRSYTNILYCTLTVFTVLCFLFLNHTVLLIYTVIFYPLLFDCRYAVQLLTPASILARINAGAEAGAAVEISDGDIDEVRSLFLDAKSSARVLADNASKYMR